MSQQTAFLSFENVAIRSGESVRFAPLNWRWNTHEQWAILGSDESGKSLIVRALAGQVPLATGEIRGPNDPSHNGEVDPAEVVAVVSPETQRQAAMSGSSFYQSRWHSGFDAKDQTVADFLAQARVERRNPYEIGGKHGNVRQFQRARRLYVDWLGLRPLWRRQVAHLSNGEFRKVLLGEALLRKPRLLILEETSAGLDVATRAVLKRVVTQLMRRGWRILTVTNRVEEIPAPTTHVLIIDRFKVVAAGAKRDMVRVWKSRCSADRGVPRSHFSRPKRATNQFGDKWFGKPLVELRNVTIEGTRELILRDVTWTLRRGERWALLGPNGAGKTTLLNLIQGDHPQAYAQQIAIFGRNVDSTQAIWQARQRMGWVSPELHYHYPGGWAAVDVVASGFFNSIGLHQPCSRRQRSAASDWLRTVGLGEYESVPFEELSFGQQRIVLLARAAVKKPDLLILDEPCQGLDAHQRSRVLGAVDKVVWQTGCSLVFVTHHPKEIPDCITHRLRIADGRVVQQSLHGNFT